MKVRIFPQFGRWLALERQDIEQLIYRPPGKCRGTPPFANQKLSSYVRVEWVARQLGHAATTMVRKHYGRWIPKDTKSMADIVSKMLGFRASGMQDKIYALSNRSETKKPP